ESGSFVNKTGVYRSPQRFFKENSWEWSNFTWNNDSVTGTIGWKVWYNDTLGHWNSTDISSFLVDGDSPDITVFSPSNSTTGDSTPDLRVSADETVHTWKYNVDSSSNTTFQPNITLSALSDGRHNVTVWANDSVGNYNRSVVWFRVDTTPPRWRNQMQNLSSIQPGKTIGLSAQGLDTVNLSHAVLSTNESGSFVNKTGVYRSPQRFYKENSWEWSNFTWNNDSVRGKVGWKIWYNDTAGNWNVTNVSSFGVTAAKSEYVRTFRDNGRPRSFLAKGRNVTIETDGKFSTAPKVSVTDSNGTTRVDSQEMVNASGKYRFNYTLNGSFGWYDVKIGQTNWDKAFYQGRVWQGNFTDSSGNSYTFRRRLNV
ncbi:MAG: hypothetical protein SVV03_06175, partial [Candidatus Nanohaloarchaea archaeon]|nr:hypothetical protein [Candidatus Nanohaloarchaea archaeon]